MNRYPKQTAGALCKEKVKKIEMSLLMTAKIAKQSQMTRDTNDRSFRPILILVEQTETCKTDNGLAVAATVKNKKKEDIFRPPGRERVAILTKTKTH